MEKFMGTPGPWKLDDFNNVIHSRSSGPFDIVKVSGVSLPGRVTEEYAANTRLVSAAPEMLEALQFALSAMNEMGDILNFHDLADEKTVMKLTPAFDAAREAINKALGKE